MSSRPLSYEWQICSWTPFSDPQASALSLYWRDSMFYKTMSCLIPTDPVEVQHSRTPSCYAARSILLSAAPKARRWRGLVSVANGFPYA